MDYHKNAPWTAISRERLARLVIDDGLRVSAAAVRFCVSAKTAAKWVDRYRQLGTAGLADRSSRAGYSRNYIGLVEQGKTSPLGVRPSFMRVFIAQADFSAPFYSGIGYSLGTCAGIRRLVRRLCQFAGNAR